MKIIPEPLKCSFTGKKHSFGKLRITGMPSSEYALEILADFIAEDADKTLSFEKLGPGRNAEGYEIEIDKSGVVVRASGKGGFIYAAATLKQLARFSGKALILPGCRISDEPKFAIRGVNWNLMAEIRSWSQDDGSGYDGFMENCIAGLDLLAEYKLNFVFVDGVGWDTGSIKNYGALMRKLNWEARKRNVRLCYVGYSAGYEHQKDEDENTFFNRISYPDGEKYDCCGMASGKLRNKGTCFSNPELIRLKCENLKRFVREVEPGALYIHGLDNSIHDMCVRSWLQRCPACREKFPDDNVNAVDGLAGACAFLYNKLYEAVASVSNPQSGYDAARDCMVNMVGPNYTNCYETDQEWQYHLEYFRNIFRKLEHENIYLMLREQFFNQKKGIPRFRELRNAVGKKGRISCIYFGSGAVDLSPVTGDFEFIRLFDGVDAVVTGNGNAFQETRQVLSAAFLWNPCGKYSLPFPETCEMDEFMKMYQKMIFSMKNAKGVFGSGGLLDAACEKLYGKEAGKLVSKAQRLRSETEPNCGYTAPLFNPVLPGWYFTKFRNANWHENMDEKSIGEIRTLMVLMKELAELNQTASGLFDEAASKAERRKKHLQRMAETCREAAAFESILVRWSEFLLKASRSTAKSKEAEGLKNELKQFQKMLKKQAPNPIDRDGGDPGFAIKLADYILSELDSIQYTLEHPGKYNVLNKKVYGT